MSLTLSVIGLGPLGAVHAVCMADVGHTVFAVDASMPERAQALARGETPFYEPGLQELLERALATGRLTFTSDYADAAGADVHFLCTGTPQRKGEYAADLTWVDAAIEALGPLLSRRTLVVGKSTVPVGTAAARQLDGSRIMHPAMAVVQAAALAGITAGVAAADAALRSGQVTRNDLEVALRVARLGPGRADARAARRDVRSASRVPR